MGIEIKPPGRTRGEQLGDMLQLVDYRAADTSIDLDQIYRLRYQAYMREGGIRQNKDRRFTDEYDQMPNCWIFGLYIDDWLVSSIRFHVISSDFRRGPAPDVFPDLIWPMIEAGNTLVDPTRFVVDERASREFPEIAFLTLRVAVMASEYFEADYCLATVRREHQAFYRRLFHSECMCVPRPYPTLAQPIALLRADVPAIRDMVMARNPVFLSSYTERRMLFERATVPLAANSTLAGVAELEKLN